MLLLLIFVFIAGCKDSPESLVQATGQTAERPTIRVEIQATPLPSLTQLPTQLPSATPTIVSATPEIVLEEAVTTREYNIYFPLHSEAQEPTPTPTNTPIPTPTPTIDFRAVREQLLAQGNELGFSKIGFHAGPAGNRNGIGEWMNRLDSAGVPFFIKSADDAGPLFEAQQIVKSSQVPHVLVFRRSGDEYDTPNYDLPPAEAAREHWRLHLEAFPPELDPQVVWIETINEVDKNRSEWLGRFAIETSRLALSDGYRWAAFGWSSGEPEVSDWRSPSMIEFLRLAAANPERLAIALHEYSYSVEDIADGYPFKVGRFQQLYQVTDQLGIPRPTVLITEWGWEYSRIPSVGQAVIDIEWAAQLYADYPQVKGVAIWYLGGGFAGIATMTQKLIKPVTEFSLGNYYPIPLPPDRAAIDPERYRP